jgi:hypothetical protein
MPTNLEIECRGFYAELLEAHERARAGCEEHIREGIDAAFACGEHRLRSAIESVPPSSAVCPGGRDYTVATDRVPALLEEIWTLCARVLNLAARDEQHRLVLAAVSAHLMRDVLEPQFRAHPEYRTRYGT